MISDDLTQTYQVEPGRVICEALAERQSLMEVKDLGMINVEKIFGIGAIRHHKNLQLVVELVHEETLSQENVTFFDTPILKVQIQVEAGRNIATLIETAALNYRLKLLGQDATVEFESRLKNTLKRG